MRKKIVLAALALLFLVPIVAAAEGDVGLIMEPLNKIYDLVKAVISVVAILAITFAGAKFMFSGDNIQAREGAVAMKTPSSSCSIIALNFMVFHI